MAELHLIAGIAFVVVAWLIPRSVAGTPFRLGPALVLDAAPMAVGAALLILLSSRPVFAGVVMFALGIGFTVADLTMRRTLREPVVFSAVGELPQVFTHPHLYLPFAGPGLVLGGAAGAVAVAAALLLWEPPVATPRPLAAVLAAAAIVAAFRLASRQPWLGRVAALFRRLGPEGEPFADAARLGPMAMQLVHCALARDERSRRRAELAARAAPRPARKGGNGTMPGPVVLVQCESFFDARRLSPELPRDLLPGFDACCDGGTYGRLAVPGWGANTMRTEFAVLTGIPENALGYDRFNPYYALARQPLASQVWRLREAGYRTICLHPFDRRFFRRDLVMPVLGFDEFLGRDTLGGSRTPPYFSDPDLAAAVLRRLDGEGPRVFVFVITMGNHGPWLAPGGDAGGMPQGGELARYLDGLRRSDEMLRRLRDGLAALSPGAVLGLYGDHLPSLPHAFNYFGFDESDSDYVIWSPTQPGAGRRDLPAHRLGAEIVDRVLGGH